MKFKNYVLTIVKALALTAMTVGLANCSKDDNNSGSSNTYYWSNSICYQNVNGTAVQVNQTYCSTNSTYSYNTSGQCIITATGQQVAQTYCSTNSTYSYNAYGQCIITSTGQQVAQTYCANNGTSGQYVMSGNQCYQVSGTQYIPVNYTYCMGNTGGATSQTCSGVYYYGGMSYNCGVTHNCSGVVMQNQYGQSVQCL